MKFFEQNWNRKASDVVKILITALASPVQSCNNDNNY